MGPVTGGCRASSLAPPRVEGEPLRRLVESERGLVGDRPVEREEEVRREGEVDDLEVQEFLETESEVPETEEVAVTVSPNPPRTLR